MIPANFSEANCKFNPPNDLEESQCMTIGGYAGRVSGGSVDGAPLYIVAWQPTKQEIEDIKNGKLIFISFIGGVPPHFPTTDFHSASHPA